jgi:hypothetical protein
MLYRFLKDWSINNLTRLFDRDIWAFFYQNVDLKGELHSPYYRPIFALALMINYSYAGINPFWWHLTAILLHIVATILAYRLLLVSLRACAMGDRKSPWLAAIGATIFAIHSAQSESVAWIAAYVNALSSIFIFGALIAYLRARMELQRIDPLWLLFGSVLYALALLTKEISIVVPLIVVAYEIWVIDCGRKLKARLSSGFLISIPFNAVKVRQIIDELTAKLNDEENSLKTLPPSR